MYLVYKLFTDDADLLHSSLLSCARTRSKILVVNMMYYLLLLTADECGRGQNLPSIFKLSRSIFRRDEECRNRNCILEDSTLAGSIIVVISIFTDLEIHFLLRNSSVPLPLVHSSKTIQSFPTLLEGKYSKIIFSPFFRRIE